MKYVYLSSGLFGATVLKYLDPKPALIITQPDRLGGRGMKTLISTPVKLYCLEHHHRLKERSHLSEGETFDLALVADYGVIIKKELLDKPKYGFWNIHPSLLPKYRGTSPLQIALLNGDKQTGVSIIKMDERIDHGSIIAQQKIEIDFKDTYLTLLEKTAELGASMFNKLDPTSIELTDQNHSLATYTKKLTKQDGYIPVEQLVPYLKPIFRKYNLMHLLPPTATEPIDALKLHNLIRALNPWPGVWTTTTQKIFKLNQSIWQKTVLITQLQLEGKTYT